MSPRARAFHSVWVPILVLAFVVPALGCGAVRGRRGTPKESGFLRDYSELKHREGYDAQLVYVSPTADWSHYTAIEIDSVTLWANSADVKLSPKDQKMLTDVMYKALHERLAKDFKLVQEPGADVIRIRAALTAAKGANVPLRTMSTIVPQMLLIGTAVGLSADTARTVGDATAELELLDSVTGERLAAGVDERAGTKSLLTTRTFSTWGDVKAAADYWADRIAQFLVREGVQRKPGAKS
jgi:hypothetical protein